MYTRREFVALAAAVTASAALSSALAACGASGQASPASAAGSSAAPPKAADFKAIEEGAKREAGLTFYGAFNPSDTTDLVAGFNAQYAGVKVDTVRLASSPLAQRYASEAQADHVVADVLQTNELQLFQEATQKGWLTPLDGLPALANWPAKYRTATYATIDLSVYHVAFNTNLVRESELGTSWDSLLDSRWAGKIMLIDPRNTPAVLSFVNMLYKHYGADFLRKLAAQRLKLVDSGVPGGQELAAGTADILIPVNHSNVTGLQKQGAPVADKLFEPLTGTEQYIGVSTKAPHPNAARLFANFLLSTAGQKILTRNGYNSVIADQLGEPALPAGYESPDLQGAKASQDQLLKLIGIS
jgi:iron(III) transport system substrate-binding protein